MGHKERPAAARLPVIEEDRPSSGQRQGMHAARARRRGAPGPLSLRNWPVAGRLFAVIVLAATTGLAFGGAQVAAAVAQASQYAQVTKLALLGQQGIVLAQALEEERAESAMFLAAGNGSGQDLPSELAPYYGPLQQDGLNDVTAGYTGRAADKFQALAAGIGSSYPAGTRNDVAAVQQLVIAELGGLRSGIQSTGGTPAPGGGQLNALIDYNSIIPSLFSLNDVIAQGSTDPVLISDVQALGALSRAKDQVSQQRAIVWAALTSFALYPGAYTGAGGAHGIQGILAALSTSQTEQVGYLESYVASATPAEQAELQTTAFRQPNASMQSIEDYLTGQQSLDVSTLLEPSNGTAPDQWKSISAGAVDQYGQVESRIAQAIVDRSQADQQAARHSAWLTAILTSVILLIVMLLALLVARSVVLPLRRLKASALDIATVSLPERVQAIGESGDPAESGSESLEVDPVSVQSTDEIGQVARAFDLVHQEAVRLAGNEAMLRGSLNAMFVSLSRRSQSLIERLSRMIDSLELNEDDPERLSNLFTMDHLVTRMRRNSENLLVLAGYEGGRKRTEPVLLGDVLRAATSEIEQYGRVVLSVQAGIEVSGQAATDVVHLLAEIIENATIFSPRATEVHVIGQEIASGGVLIEVADGGVGISDARLEHLNWRLENPPVVDVSVSRHMGLFAVSHLAARHGVRVRLRPASSRGLIAMVWLPDTVAGPASIGYGERLRRLGAVRNLTRVPSSPVASPGLAAAASRASSAGTSPASPPAAPPLVTAGVPVHGSPREYGGGEYGTGQPAEQATSNWFRSMRTFGGPQQPSSVPPARPAMPGGASARAPEAPGWKFFQEAPEPARSSMTGAGLPQRVPQANRMPGAHEGQGWRTQSGEEPARAPQSGEMAGTAPRLLAGQPRPLPRRSPESARNRLGGFQRGARRAEGQLPGAGEGPQR